MTVEQLAQLVIQRIDGQPQCAVLDAVSEVQRIIVARLFHWRDKSLHATKSLYISAGQSTASLPDGFLGLRNRPYIVLSGVRITLKQARTSRPVDPGTPFCYDLSSSQISVFPPVDVGTYLNLDCFLSPAVPATLDDDLLFTGLFDSIFLDGCTRLAQQGRLLLSDAAFLNSLQGHVDGLAKANQLADEQILANDINDADY